MKTDPSMIKKQAKHQIKFKEIINTNFQFGFPRGHNF